MTDKTHAKYSGKGNKTHRKALQNSFTQPKEFAVF